MVFEEVKKALSLTSDALRDGFADSFTSVRDADTYLAEEFVRTNTSRLAMSDEIAGSLIDGLSFFRDEHAKALFWHCRLKIALGEKADLKGWGTPAGRPYAALFYAYVILSFVPDTFATHAKRGIPEAVTRDTLADIEIWIRTNKERYGEYGFQEVGWLSNHIRGKLYGLGRLQFIMEPFGFEDIVLRGNDGAVVVLAPDGKKYRADGLYDGVNGITDPHAKTTMFRETADAFEGNIIAPHGRVTDTVLRFPKSSCRRVVAEGDNALSFHIPASGPMDHAACGESFARANAFFPKYFPEYGSKVFFSTSWLYDGELEKVLPPASNIVKFQREFYRIPFDKATDDQMFERVFLKRYENIDEAPQKTSVQKALAAHMKAGGRFRSANAILLPEDNGWDTPYRK